MRIPLIAFVIALLTQPSPSDIAAEAQPAEHPLLPGVRSPEVWNPDWPSVAHDKLLTGFSPLKCGMQRAPVVLTTIHPGGTASYAAFLTDRHNGPFLLVQDSVLRRIDAQGNVVWQYSGGQVAFYRQLHGDETYTLGLVSGRTLVLIDPATGKPFWRYTFGRLKLDGQGYGPALSADFNSDGKGEFLIGNFCIGTDDQGQGKILWRMPVSASSWFAIADLNGDGRAEIIIPGSDGQVRVLTAE